MASRYTKKIPEFVYFVGEGEWIEGPYVHPKKGYKNRKFKLTEVCDTKELREKMPIVAPGTAATQTTPTIAD